MSEETRNILKLATKAALAVFEEHGFDGAIAMTLDAGDETEVFFVSPHEGGEVLLARIRAEINARSAARVS